jgi:hypothetical protein
MRTEQGRRPGVAPVRVCVYVCLSLLPALGCGTPDVTGDNDRENGGNVPGAGSGGSPGSAGGSALLPDGGFGNTTAPPMMSMLRDSGSAGDAGCGATSLEAEQIVIETEVLHEMVVETPKPVALYLMLDQSRSSTT